tara:strand:- start:7538 stop:8119 length:582 start_codon:yes stop_codon:yes gene_type:complete
MSLDNLKKLRPEERIKRLKEMEEERKKESEESKKMIENSKLEIEEELMKKMQVPDQEPVKIEELFQPQEEPITPIEFEKKETEVETDLETITEKTELPPEQVLAEQKQYDVGKLQDFFKEKSSKDIYKSVANLMDKPASQMNAYEQNKVEAAYQEMGDRAKQYSSSAEGQNINQNVDKVMSLHSRINQDLYRS